MHSLQRLSLLAGEAGLRDAVLLRAPLICWEADREGEFERGMERGSLDIWELVFSVVPLKLHLTRGSYVAPPRSRGVHEDI